MSNRKLSSFMAVIVATGLTMPLAGIAASPNQLYEEPVTVSFSDLDIDTAAGAKKLYLRLQKATEQFCGLESYTTVRSLAILSEARSCYAETLSATVDKIDSDALTRIHRS